MKKYSLLTILLISFTHASLLAQDPVFSQPYISPVYLNPAATGSGEMDWRTTGMIRRQWWSIASRFTYAAFSVDKFIRPLRSGIGIMYTSSSEGYLKRNGIYGSFAYSFFPECGDVSENEPNPNWFLTGALQFGWVQRRIDYKDLLFADQINTTGITGAETQADLPANSGRWYPDISSGLIFSKATEKSRVLIGVSAKHVNRPDESLTGTNSIAKSRVPVLWSINGLYTRLTDNWTYTFAGNYSKQQENSLLQAGIEIVRNELPLSLGVWYKGGGVFSNPDAISLCFTFHFSGQDEKSSKVRTGFAHDAQIGGKKYSNTRGSSEFGFIWDQAAKNGEGNNMCKPRISPWTCPIP